MPTKADVYTIFIASPSDLGDERAAIPELIHEWNAAHGLPNGIIFVPVKWETHSSPMLGDRPQNIINTQILDKCDLLVALFWTRIGQDTGVDVSGTVEEIRRFVADGKPALLYFSERPIEPNKIDVDQLQKLNSFKQEIKAKGLIESFSDLYDFRVKFARQLNITISRIITESTNGISKSKRETIIESSHINLTSEEIRQWLYNAFIAVQKGDGSAELSAFASYLSRYTPIDYKAYGFNKMKPFLESYQMFEFQIIDPTHQLIRIKSD